MSNFNFFMMKMRFIAVAFAAAAILASCTKERVQNDANVDPTSVTEGVQTYASFNFAVASPDGSKVPLLSDATETTPVPINSIRLIIFKNTAQSTVCEVNKLVTLATGQMSEAMLLTSGTKKIFIVANEGTGSVANLVAATKIIPNTSTLSDFYATLSTLDVNGSGADTYDISQLISPSGMVLTNSADVTSTYVLAPGITKLQAESSSVGTNNKFEITVKRVVAKGKVVYGLSATDGGSNVITADGKGVLTNLKYTIRNARRATYLMQQFRTGAESPAGQTTNVLCPDDAASSHEFVSSQPNYSDGWDYYRNYFYSQGVSGSNGFDFTGNIIAAASDSPSNPAYYFTENINAIQRVANSTWASVQTTFTPKANQYVTSTVYDKVNGKFTTVTLGTTTPATGTLYVTTKSAVGLPAGAIFINQTAALQAAFSVKYPDAEYLEDNSAFIAWSTGAGSSDRIAEVLNTYLGGVCYYRLVFGEGSTVANTFQSGVTRNNYYKATISKFASIGTVTEVESDPKEPLETNTYVHVVIRVLDWNDVTSIIEL